MSVNLYPQLLKHFKTVKELADAGCMSRTRAWQCLSGQRMFTDNEKRAIWNAIVLKEHKLNVVGDFDEQFKRKVTA